MPDLCVNNISFKFRIQKNILQDLMAADVQLVQAGTIGNTENTDELIGHVR